MAFDGATRGLGTGHRAGRAAHLTFDEPLDLALVAETDPAQLRLCAT